MNIAHRFDIGSRANSSDRVVMSTRPLKTAIVYDFYLFVQLFVFVLLCYSVGRLALAIDRMTGRQTLTQGITRALEAVAAVAVIKK